jgi:hypothetical protein
MKAENSSQKRRTDNTMAKIKRTLGQTIIYKIPHRKPNTEHNEPHYKPG